MKIFGKMGWINRRISEIQARAEEAGIDAEVFRTIIRQSNEIVIVIDSGMSLIGVVYLHPHNQKQFSTPAYGLDDGMLKLFYQVTEGAYK